MPPRPDLVVGELIEDRTVTFIASLGCAASSVEIQTTATFIVVKPVQVALALYTPPPRTTLGTLELSAADVVLPDPGAGDNGGAQSESPRTGSGGSEFERYLPILAAGCPWLGLDFRTVSHTRLISAPPFTLTRRAPLFSVATLIACMPIVVTVLCCDCDCAVAVL